MCDTYGMTKEQKEVWMLKQEYEKDKFNFNIHRIIFWKRFNCNVLFADSEQGSELFEIAYHQVGKEKQLQFFESFDIILEL